MSKKATRRAARDAFPKAKTPAPGSKSVGARSAGTRSGGVKSTSGRSGGGVKGRPRAAQALRPPSVKRAAIQGAVLAILYFVVIEYVWAPKDAAGHRTANVWGSLLIAVIGFVAYSCIAYFVDRYTYQRKLRKLKGSAK
jgi:hypothetical protein